jgi:hypothetical protein
MPQDLPTTRAWLPPKVFAVPIDNDLVFLDVGRDSYFCWPGNDGRVDLRAHAAEVVVSDSRVAADLTAAGLLVDHNDPEARRGAPPTPTFSAIPPAHEPPQWRDILQAARCLIDLWFTYARRPFSEILRRSGGAGRAICEASPTPELLALVTRFHRWIPYAPVSAKCLLRSYLLLRLLRRHGHDAAWVFGVATWPFRAHCWLQCGEVVLNDDVDRLTPYVPILVL